MSVKKTDENRDAEQYRRALAFTRDWERTMRELGPKPDLNRFFEELGELGNRHGEFVARATYKRILGGDRLLAVVWAAYLLEGEDDGDLAGRFAKQTEYIN